jgi:hypothetical protein
MFLRSAICIVSCLFLAISAPADETVRFNVEVMAVLSKAGCNQGACHGNLNGKGGFRLSLRGEDPDWDFNILTREAVGRRTNPLRPADSLILQKATAAIPHEGGRRFAVGSVEYDVLRRWIAAGAPASHEPTGMVSLTVEPTERILVEPAERATIRVTAKFRNGTVRDVTRLACYELSNPEIATADVDGTMVKAQNGETAVDVRFLDRHATVRLAFVPARPGFRWENPAEANFIDTHIFAKLKALRMNPSPICDDATFLRRVFIDTIGTLPTVAETKTFLTDQNQDKRPRLIDDLLKRPEFADYWALKWCDLLRNEEKVLDRKGVQAFHGWIRKAIADGQPMNEFARDLIAARGSTYANPAANYYRALRDPLTRSEATAQVFLGIRLQCARCHNHPFDRWTQNDYYQLAAFFPRVKYRIVENNRRDKFDQHEFDGEQIVWMDRAGEVVHPKTNSPASPRFLDDQAKVSDESDRLLALAEWVAKPDNPFFARAQANRIWGHLMGRALVEPDDDFRTTNPPSHPELVDALARDFAQNHFDLRHLIRTILNSRTYQLKWEPNDTNRFDDVNDSHATVRRMEAEVLLDALSQVLEVPVHFQGQPLGVRAIQLPGVQPKERNARTTNGEKFLRTFGKPDRLLSCDCERNADATIPQSLILLTGEPLLSMIRDPNNRLGRLLIAGKSDTEILDELFVAALCRTPTASESREFAAYSKKKPSHRREALEDIAWAVLNTKEFLFRR